MNSVIEDLKAKLKKHESFRESVLQRLKKRKTWMQEDEKIIADVTVKIQETFEAIRTLERNNN